MAHIWVRAEQRAQEQRVGVTPHGVSQLMAAGHAVTVEESPVRAIAMEDYVATGCDVAAAHSWVDAPENAIIFGLKELDPDGPDLRHRHIMFGHAYKGQSDGPQLLSRFRRGGGVLLDLEYLTDEAGRRVAAFGYWAGYAGAAVGLMAYAAQTGAAQAGAGQIGAGQLGAVGVYAEKDALLKDLRARLGGVPAASGIVIGALGRVGTGAGDLLDAVGVPVTRWDIDQTRGGGPFPEILTHTLFVNCILAGPGVPVFVPKPALATPRVLRVIADVSCDPSSSYNPVPIYDHATSFADPVIRVAGGEAPLDVMAIDNLPSMLPVESSQDYAAQLLPHLMALDSDPLGVWARAEAIFRQHIDVR